MDTYIAPATFAEFLDRYPQLVANVLRKRKSWLKDLDLTDLEQEVYLHLMSLPEDSCYRQRGCVDRISTFDATRAVGNIEGLFVGYCTGIIDNYLISRQTRSRNKVISASVPVSDLGDATEQDMDEDVLLARFANLGFSPYYSDAGLIFEETLDVAFAVHPMIAYAGVAMAVFDKKAEACAFLRITDEKLNRLLQGLRAVIEGDQETLSKFRVREAYRARKVRA